MNDDKRVVRPVILISFNEPSIDVVKFSRFLVAASHAPWFLLMLGASNVDTKEQPVN
jgi:hypothetical protein